MPSVQSHYIRMYRTTVHAYIRVCAHVASACYTVPLDDNEAAVSDVTRKKTTNKVMPNSKYKFTKHTMKV